MEILAPPLAGLTVAAANALLTTKKPLTINAAAKITTADSLRIFEYLSPTRERVYFDFFI